MNTNATPFHSSPGQDGGPSSPYGSHGSPGTAPTDYSPLANRTMGNPLTFHQPVSLAVSQIDQYLTIVRNQLQQGPIPVTTVSPILDTLFVGNFFTTELQGPQQFTRYLEVTAPGNRDLGDIIKLDPAFRDAVPLSTGREQPAFPKKIRFDNLRQAEEGFKILKEHQFVVRFIKNVDYFQAKYDSIDYGKRHEGQLSIWIDVFGTATPGFQLPQLVDYLRNILWHHLSLYTTSASQLFDIRADVRYHNSIRFRVEFCSLSASRRALKFLEDSLLAPQVVGNEMFSWFIRGAAEYSESKEMAALTGLTGDGVPVPVNNMQQMPYQVDQYDQFAHGHDQNPNRVQIGRIVTGQDVRTTIMLRNIPNRMDWMCLRELLDRYCFGTYDFVYLRIDFQTCSNVGYAFINFINAEALISAVQHIEGRYWSGYSSSKHAEISYATIQGKEALIQKFRNSSVMQEAAYCRPRTFYSTGDARMVGNIYLTGTEMEFPGPDNLPKLHRSIANARNVGLYPPHSSGHIQDHRSRFSMFDRGTPRDQIETAAATAGPSEMGHIGTRRTVPGYAAPPQFGINNHQDSYRARAMPGPIQRPSMGSPTAFRNGKAPAHSESVFFQPGQYPKDGYPQ